MPDLVQLVGLDFGTTTSSALVASARLLTSSVSGRLEFGAIEEVLRSPRVFTPRRGDLLDLAALERLLDSWLADVRDDLLFGGGALLTGLTARAANAQALVGLIRARLRQALVAVADDPCLESWLAFQASAAALSRAHPGTPILNLDIGGGTTNLALGIDGEVQSTGCLVVGARHFQVQPGSYRLVRLSACAQSLLRRLDIRKEPGDTLVAGEIDTILDYFMGLLERTIAGVAPTNDLDLLHTEVEFRLPSLAAQPIVTLSGGVGEMVYAALQGQEWPATTAFGDLGIDLARRILECRRWHDDLSRVIPDAGGRATLLGLMRHGTEVSGSTIFLTRPGALPLADMPILGSIAPASTSEEINTLLQLAMRSACGACLVATLPDAGAQPVRILGSRMADQLRRMKFPAGHPLIIIVRENVGRTLGQYITNWGELALNLIVIDEVSCRDAQYLQVGRFQHQAVPVAFYGLQPSSRQS